MRNWFSILVLLILSLSAFSQGCSDAGFCTMGAMKPDQSFVKTKNLKLRTLDVQQYLGLTRFKDKIHVTNLELNVLAFKNYNLQLKAPFYVINGPLGDNQGLGDLSLSGTRAILSKDNFVINGTIGTKIPTNHADAKRGDVTMPMYYQTSLGTFDFVAGISLVAKGWLFATGYQQVVYNINNNDFKWGPWKEFGFFETAKSYQSSIGLQRGKDVMFRVEKNFTFSKFNFYLGLLDVWRLNEDTSIDPNTGKRVIIEDSVGTSKGMAITGLSGFGYNISVKSELKFMYGQRIKKRHINADGLSREQVFTLGYQYKF